jgi:predicted dehydrogenase
MRKVGIGIAGFGFIGNVHALAFQSLPYYYTDLPYIPDIRGICTSRPDTAIKAQQETGVPFVTSSIDELCERKDIDIIVIALPNAHHLKAVLSAAQTGKAIYCDKPLAMKLDEALEMKQIIIKNQVVFGMSFQNRFVAAILRAKQLIDNGLIGEIYRVRGTYLHSGYGDPTRPMSWRLKKEIAGGGALADLGSHLSDLIHYLIGNTTIVSAKGRTFITERPRSAQNQELEKVYVDDWSQVDFVLDNQSPGTIEVSRFATGSCDEMRLEIEGSLGALRFNSMQPNFLEVFDTRKIPGAYGGERGFQKIESVQQYPYPNRIPGKFAVGWVRSHIACAHDFLQKFAGKPSIVATIDDGIKVQEFLDTSYRLMGYE